MNTNRVLEQCSVGCNQRSRGRLWALEVGAMPSTQSIKHFQDGIVALGLPKFCSVEGDSNDMVARATSCCTVTANIFSPGLHSMSDAFKLVRCLSYR